LRGVPTLTPNPREVADVFSVPLSLFADETRVRREERQFLGRVHDVWFYDTGKYVVWGVTAAVIRSLIQRAAS